MTLSINNPFSKGNFGKGIYINKATVVYAEDISNTSPEHMQRKVDIGIKLTLDIGKDWNPEMIIAGNFEREDSTNSIVGWGSAWVVQDALYRLGFKTSLNEDNSLPESSLQDIVGQPFFKLSYVSGQKEDFKYKYSTWYVIASIEDGAQFLYDRFLRSYDKGYPKNYLPELTEPQSIDIEESKVESEPDTNTSFKLTSSNNGFDDFDTSNQY